MVLTYTFFFNVARYLHPLGCSHQPKTQPLQYFRSKPKGNKKLLKDYKTKKGRKIEVFT
jgi:hypothetical protein